MSAQRRTPQTLPVLVTPGAFVFVANLSGLNDAAPRKINVVLNWHSELLERVPVDSGPNEH